MPLGLKPSFNSLYHGALEGQMPREISLHRVADPRMKELSSLPHQGLLKLLWRNDKGSSGNCWEVLKFLFT